jgi:hypothetical protein
MGENWFEIDQTGIEMAVFEWKVRWFCGILACSQTFGLLSDSLCSLVRKSEICSLLRAYRPCFCLKVPLQKNEIHAIHGAIERRERRLIVCEHY